MRLLPSNNLFLIKLIYFFIILGISLLGGCTLFNIQIGSVMSDLEEIVVSGKGDNKVLVIEIEGIISNHDKKSTLGSKLDSGMVERVKDFLRKAEEDNSIKAILLRINSPGGTVTSSDIIFHELKLFKNKTKIKIYASLMDVAASGGYYIALAADKIIAHPTSIIGSIGVIAMKLNLKGLLEKIGVDVEIVKSGDKKDFLSPMRPFTREERRLFQATIDGYHNRFVQLVFENRKILDILKVRELADGRVFNSRQAHENGLVDGVGYMEDIVEMFKNDLMIDDFRLISYHRKGDYKSNIYSSIPQFRTMNLFDFNLFNSKTPVSPAFMYLWTP